MTLPNIITIARLFLVPVTIYYVLQGETMIAFWLFLLAGISDAVDGVIARVWQLSSALGAMLDPLADKALLVGVYVALAVVGVVPEWLVWLVVARDVMIVAGFGVAWALRGKMPVKPSFLSKVNTTVQIILAAAALCITGYDLNLYGAIDILVVLTALTTAGSLIGYAIRWRNYMARTRPAVPNDEEANLRRERP